MRALIELEGMEFHAYHGCYAAERRVGGRFVVGLRVEAQIGEAAARDDVSATINYLDLYAIVREQMAIPADIIEAVAHRIAGAVRARFGERVVDVQVRVAKVAPPLGGKVGAVSVTI